jgi:hypothetical protein
VSLKPSDVAAIVFWSKNYAPLLSKLEDVEETTENLFFHFTITGNRELEPGVPDPSDTIRDYVFLSRRYSTGQIIWRFDPLCITKNLSYEIHEERFAHCAEKLRGIATRCIISFAYPYKKVLVNMEKQGDLRLMGLSQEQKKEYARRLAARAAPYGIRLFACCNDYLISETVGKAACIDGRYLAGLFEGHFDTRPAVTRKECACTKSVDIGAYDTCAHGCLYCYASSDQGRVRAALQKHDPEWNALNAQVGETVAEPRAEEQPFLFR